jgi:hypothetical protein
VRSALPALAGALLLLGVLVLLGTLLVGRAGRLVRRELAVARSAYRAYPGILLASLLAVAGHTATFLVAVRATGTRAPLSRLLPIALLVLVAMAVPTNLGGWGPREGVAAWAFGAAGLGADAGLAAAVGYGVLVLVASLPGAVVLAVTARRDRQAASRPAAVEVVTARV